MSTRVDIPDYDNVKPILEKFCKCGHKLYQHGFTDNYDYSTGGHYFRVSQCIFGDCEEFEEKIEE